MVDWRMAGIDDYNEGWISEQDLEDKLSLILKLKVCGN